MKIVDTYTEGNFIVAKYDNGSIVKTIEGLGCEFVPPSMSEDEIERLETALNIEYLVSLMETELYRRQNI